MKNTLEKIQDWLNSYPKDRESLLFFDASVMVFSNTITLYRLDPITKKPDYSRSPIRLKVEEDADK